MKKPWRTSPGFSRQAVSLDRRSKLWKVNLRVDGCERDWREFRHVGVAYGGDCRRCSAGGRGAGASAYVYLHGTGVLYASAIPVLCDVVPATGLIDLDDAVRKVTSKTRAIIPVHLYGQPVDMDAVMAFAAHVLAVIEDAAQSIGAEWRGRHTGTIGDFGCLSFYPQEPCTAARPVLWLRTGMARFFASFATTGRASARSMMKWDTITVWMVLVVALRHKLSRLDVWTGQRKELAAGYQMV